MQINSVYTYCTLLCNSHNQCSAESLITTVSISERSDVVVLHAYIYDDKRDSDIL